MRHVRPRAVSLTSDTHGTPHASIQTHQCKPVHALTKALHEHALSRYLKMKRHSRSRDLLPLSSMRRRISTVLHVLEVSRTGQACKCSRKEPKKRMLLFKAGFPQLNQSFLLTADWELDSGKCVRGRRRPPNFTGTDHPSKKMTKLSHNKV